MDGEASADDLSTLRPHIRTCLSCRAALREYRSAPATAAALVPAAAFAAAAPSRSPLSDISARLAESLAGWVQKGHAAVEMASAQKVAALAASTAVIASGGAATVKRVAERPDEPARAAQPAPRPVQAPPMTETPAPPPTPSVSTRPSAAQLRAARERQRRERAEERAREVGRRAPPEQQEFDPAFAGGEPASSPSATASTASAPGSEPAPAPGPTGSGEGAEEFAP